MQTFFLMFHVGFGMIFNISDTEKTPKHTTVLDIIWFNSVAYSNCHHAFSTNLFNDKYLTFITRENPILGDICFVCTEAHWILQKSYAAFILPCGFDDNICATVQVQHCHIGWQSCKQRLANKSIPLPLCPQRQIADSWIQFNSWLWSPQWQCCSAFSAATMKLQAAFTKQSGKAVSGKLVWKYHKGINKGVSFVFFVIF